MISIRGYKPLLQKNARGNHLPVAVVKRISWWKHRRCKLLPGKNVRRSDLPVATTEELILAQRQGTVVQKYTVDYEILKFVANVMNSLFLLVVVSLVVVVVGQLRGEAIG